MKYSKFIEPRWLRNNLLPMLLILLSFIVFFTFIRNNETKPYLAAPNRSALNFQSCIELLPQDSAFQEAVVSKPGRYCVATDFLQRRLCGAGHCAPASYRHLLDIGGGDVTIDLMNHTLHSDGHSSGIVAYTQANKYSVASDQENFSFTQATTRITIKNGVIDIRGLGIGVELVNQWKMLSLETPIPSSLTGYEKTEFILENLHIVTDNTGIILEGDGNIVRNCVIESNGPAAIMMAGPNGLIEGNTIILNKKTFAELTPFTINKLMEGLYNPGNIYDLIKYGRQEKAAILLHQANNTIVRKNRIEVKSGSPLRHSIYLNHESRKVHVYENTFIGIKDPVTMKNGSTATIQDNIFR